MVEYEELISKIKKTLAEDKDIHITPADIEHYSPEQINNIQNIFDQYNLNYIEKCRRQKIISEETAAYLKDIFGDGMETWRALYKNITTTLLTEYRPHKIKRMAELGEEPAPDEINAINLDTGIVEENQSIDGYHNNMSKYKEYQTKHITPFTSVRLTFYDFRDNPIYVIMPGLKNVRRAIDKTRMPVYDKNGKLIARGGKYYMQYIKEKNAIRQKYQDRIKKKYQSDSLACKQALEKLEPEIQREIAKVPLPHERLKDVVRMTITRKYYTDTVETLDMFKNDSQYGVIVSEIRDTFNGNVNDSSKYGPKNYREKRAYLNMKVKGNPFVVECQIKITKLFEGDVDTHLIYAGEENVESQDNNVILISSEYTDKRGLRFWEENLKRYINTADRLIAKMNIYKKRFAIQKRNKEAIRAYNLQVLDKAFRIEDAKLANAKPFDSEIYSPQTHSVGRIFGSVADFITNNFIYRPFKAFDKSNAFNVNDNELKSLGLLVTTEQLQEFANRYSPFIMEKYNGRISGNEITIFSESGKRHISKGTYDADANPDIGLDNNLPDKEEIEAIKELGFTYEDERAEYLYKRLDNKRRNYHNKQKQAHKHQMRREWAALKKYKSRS